MSAQGPVPAARQAGLVTRRRQPTRAARASLAACIGTWLGVAACTGPPPYALVSSIAPGATRTAEVRLVRCPGGWCESLWLGETARDATRAITLAPGSERVSEIAWLPDGTRVGILVNGYQLRLYDRQTGAPAGQLDLVPADRTPPTRLARGVTFSDTGAAITFDDCPRDRSGCRPGIAALH